MPPTALLLPLLLLQVLLRLLRLLVLPLELGIRRRKVTSGKHPAMLPIAQTCMIMEIRATRNNSHQRRRDVLRLRVSAIWIRDCGLQIGFFFWSCLTSLDDPVFPLPTTRVCGVATFSSGHMIVCGCDGRSMTVRLICYFWCPGFRLVYDNK